MLAFSCVSGCLLAYSPSPLRRPAYEFDHFLASGGERAIHVRW
jgi:hypothetical protein